MYSRLKRKKAWFLLSLNRERQRERDRREDREIEWRQTKTKRRWAHGGGETDRQTDRGKRWSSSRLTDAGIRLDSGVLLERVAIGHSLRCCCWNQVWTWVKLNVAWAQAVQQAQTDNGTCAENLYLQNVQRICIYKMCRGSVFTKCAADLYFQTVQRTCICKMCRWFVFEKCAED